MTVPAFALADYTLATARWLSSRSTGRPQVVPEFWAQAEAAETLAKTAQAYDVNPHRAIYPAAWALWLSRLTKDEYTALKARSGTELAPLPASFFRALRQPDSPQADLWLAKTEDLAQIEPRRVGLLSVMPGRLRLAHGEVPLLWAGEDKLLVELDGQEVEIDRRHEGTGYEILQRPIVLGRSRVSAEDADSRTARLPEQLRLLESLDLAQSVFPVVGCRSAVETWLGAPPVCVCGASESAAFYYLATAIFGLTCLPTTAAFTNPSTGERLTVQASIPSVVKQGGALSDERLAAVDWMLGVTERAPCVVDAAGRVWWPGPVQLWQEVGEAPVVTDREWLAGVSADALRQAVLACGYGVAEAELIAGRLQSLGCE